MEPKQVPFMIEEKNEVFWECVVLARQIIAILNSKKTKGVHTYERLLRKALGAYPIGLPTGVNQDAGFCITKADSLVLSAWFSALYHNIADVSEWKRFVKLMIEAQGLINYVYGIQGDKLVCINRKVGKRESASNARRRLAMLQIEPLRLYQLYHRASKK